MTSDFLFELGCEELPSAAVSALSEALSTHLITALDKAQLSYGQLRCFATPRRLAVWIKELEEEQPNQRLTKRGPALIAAYDTNGQPTPALIGFAKSCKVSVSDLTLSKTEKGEWFVYESLNQGAKTSELLVPIIKQALTDLPIAKPMRWGAGEEEFARPVHWVVMLFANKIIDCEILGVKAGNKSYGHRFHHPQAIEITHADCYEALLKEAYVIADFKARRNLIIKQVEDLVAGYGAQAIMPEALVDEVTSIVEWPQALLASFEEAFLEVPAEALIASMQSHQKCFALQSQEGKLLPYFITVANIVSTNPQQVIAGNEKVMRARLSDAVFFFRQDKRQTLSTHIPATKQVIFQEKLGSLKDKANRIGALMVLLARPLQLDAQEANRAAELSKCDLMTGMVGEFPELQGLMGYYYARHDGETDKVALALDEQYRPRFAADELPGSSLGLALSLADRLDTLVGIFSIGQKPSGVKDPFKLRRHALAVARILIVTSTELSLSTLIAESRKIYANCLSESASLIGELKPFILERMQSYYQGLGFSMDQIMAVRARQDDWLYDFDKRIHALASFVKLSEAAALSAACKRVNNILQQAAPAETQECVVDECLLDEGAEKALFTHLQRVEQLIKPLYANKDYGKILSQLAYLREPIDAFFEQVMVMVDDKEVRMNRLHLLSRMRSLLQGVADISLLQLTL